jgi:hypothetical protein
MTIVEFLNARLDEEETRELQQTYIEFTADFKQVNYKGNPRTLARIAAERAIIRQHGIGDGAHECPDGFLDGAKTEPHTGWEVVCMTQRHLASVYSDHPDFREEWAIRAGVEW